MFCLIVYHIRSLNIVLVALNHREILDALGGSHDKIFRPAQFIGQSSAGMMMDMICDDTLQGCIIDLPYAMCSVDLVY